MRSGVMRSGVPAALLALGVSVYLVVSGNLGFERAALETGGDGTEWILLAVLLTLLAAVNLVLQVVGWRLALKPLSLALLTITAASAYFIDEYGVALDTAMLRNALQTDVREASELLGWPFVRHMLLFCGLPGAAICSLRVRRARFRVELRSRLAAALALLVLAGGGVLATRGDLVLFWRIHGDLRSMVNPSGPIASLFNLRRELFPRSEVDLHPMGRDAHRRPPRGAERRRRLVVLVLGETATASHFSLNGYERETNPELGYRDVVNFPGVRSCATSTAESLPCLFSERGREDFSVGEARGTENLLDMLMRSGVQVLWRENNSGCKGVCDRVDVEWVENLDADPALRSAEGHFWDEALLYRLQQRFDEAPGDLFVVLHQEGSHGPAYFQRTPPAFKRFLPECTRDDVQNCDREPIVNAYDNTILYTDHVIASAIDLLQANEDESDVALLYVSDHGESLGENGLYLHGYPYWIAPDEQTHVPMLLWIPELSAEGLGFDRADVRAASGRALSHDNVFHTLLGVFDIESEVYDPALDILLRSRRVRIAELPG